MKAHLPQHQPVRRQGQLLAFSVSGAMALALTACNQSGPDQTMVAPPNDFNPRQAVAYNNTNSPPVTPCVFSSSGNGSYLSSHGYYHVYGYPGYYYRPAPGSTVEIIQGGSPNYAAGSPEEARENVARGGFGESGGGEGEGHGEGAHGGGEGGGHGGGE